MNYQEYKPFMKCYTGIYALDRGIYMTELELLDNMADMLTRTLTGFELPDKEGRLHGVKVFKQFLPLPEGVEAKPKESQIVPQGYTDEDNYTNFPCVIVRLGEMTDYEMGRIRQNIIEAQIVTCIYDNSRDCQGYRDVLNILDFVRQKFLTLPGYVLADRFRLNPDMKTELMDNQEHPYFYGITYLKFEGMRPINESIF